MKPTYMIVTLALMVATSAASLAQTAKPEAADARAPAGMSASEAPNGMSGMTGMSGTAEPAAKTPKTAVSVEIEADTMEIMETDNRAIFKGNVDASRRDQKMTADEMIVTYADVKQPDGSTKTDVQTMDSKGNVTITTRTQTITGEWAKMNVATDKLEVGGNVKVVQGKTVLNGNHLDVDLKTNRTIMSGGRVRGSFVPK